MTIEIQKSRAFESFFIENWEDWDQIDTMSLMFYGATPTPYLQERLKNHGITGRKFDIAISGDHCLMEIYKDPPEEGGKRSHLLTIPFDLGFSKDRPDIIPEKAEDA